MIDNISESMTSVFPTILFLQKKARSRKEEKEETRSTEPEN